MEAVISGLIGIKRMQDAVSLDLRRFDELIQRSKEELEARKRELAQRQALNENDSEEILILDDQIKLDEMAILKIQKAYEDGMRSVEEKNREDDIRVKEIIEHVVQEQARELQVCVKRMEELDREQFMNALKVKYGSADLEKAEELYSLWKGYLGDPSWQPFKVVMVEENDKKVVDENDDKLKELKNELGEEAYEVVANALNKFNEKNPRVRCPISELLNTSEKRAAFKDVVARLHMWSKIPRGKRPRH